MIFDISYMWAPAVKRDAAPVHYNSIIKRQSNYRVGGAFCYLSWMGKNQHLFQTHLQSHKVFLIVTLQKIILFYRVVCVSIGLFVFSKLFFLFLRFSVGCRPTRASFKSWEVGQQRGSAVALNRRKSQSAELQKNISFGTELSLIRAISSLSGPVRLSHKYLALHHSLCQLRGVSWIILNSAVRWVLQLVLCLFVRRLGVNIAFLFPSVAAESLD